MPLTIVQTLPALEVGGVERGTLEVAAELVRSGHRSIVISAGGRLVERLVAEGSEHIKMPLGKKTPLVFLEIKRLRAILDTEQVSILHSRSRLPAWISYLAWRGMKDRARCGFVTTVHGPYSVSRYSRIMTRGQKVIATSDFIQNYILKNYPDTDSRRISLVYRGVANASFPYGFKPKSEWLSHWRERFPQLADRFVVTLPGRITRWKGQEDFLQIIDKARASGVPIHGLVAGGPHPRRQTFFQQLQEKVNLMGLEKHITFLGHRDDLREIMSVSDVVCSLAQEPEAFGRTALEALCLGIPVIAYAHGGASEVLTRMFPEGLVEPFNVNAAASKLSTFYQHHPVVDDNNPFTLEQMLQKTIAIYEALHKELCNNDERKRLKNV